MSAHIYYLCGEINKSTSKTHKLSGKVDKLSGEIHQSGENSSGMLRKSRKIPAIKTIASAMIGVTSKKNLLFCDCSVKPEAYSMQTQNFNIFVAAKIFS